MPTIKYDPAFFGDASAADGGGPTPGAVIPYDPKFFGDDTTPIPDAAPDNKPSALTTFARHAAAEVVPVVAGALTGSAAGAASGRALGPWGAFGGGLAGMIGGGYAAAKAQEAALDANPEVAQALGQSPEQRQADQDTNPNAALAGDVAPNLLLARPSTAILGLRAGASAAERAAAITALKTGTKGAAVMGAVEGGREAYNDDFDPKELATQTALGFLGQKETRLGKMLDPFGDHSTPATNTQPIPDDKPTSLLALPRGTDFYASESGLVTPDKDVRAAANDAAPVGTQGDLFALGGEDTSQQPRAGLEVSQPLADQPPPPDQGGQAPIPMDGAGQPSLFTAAPTATVVPQFGPKEVRQAVIGATKPDAYGLKLAQKVHGFLKDGDPVAAQQHVSDETDNLEFADLKPKTIDARKAQLDRAKALVADFTSKMTNAHAEEAVQQPRPEPANNVAPAPVEPSVAAIRDDNAQRAAAEAPAPAKPGPTDADIAHANQVVDDSRRAATLKHVLEDPETISPVKRFAALLKRQNLDPTPRPYEKEEIISHLVRKGRLEDAKTAFDGLTDTGHKPDASGTAAMEALIPERGAKPTAQPKVETPPPVRQPAPFKLESQSEGDLAAIEAARVRREGKGQRRDAAAEAAKPAAKQGELFTEKGNPTKVARDAAKRPPLPKDKPAKVETTTKEKSRGKEDVRRSDVGKEGRNGREEDGQKAREKRQVDAQEGQVDYASVKKRADAAVSARSITPAQHGMVEAAIAAKSHTPEELHGHIDKMVERGSEKAFESAAREDAAKAEDVREKITAAPRTTEIIKSGGSLHDVLTHIADHSLDETHKYYAKLLAKLLRKNEVGFRPMTNAEIVGPSGNMREGLYFPRKNEIAIHPEMASHGVDRTVIHEAIHAVTVHAIAEGTPAGKQITALYKAYTDMAGVGKSFHSNGDQYGFRNADEFVAEAFSNNRFRRVLEGVKQDGNPTNFLTRFINAVRAVLGYPKLDPLKRILEGEPKLPSMLQAALKEGAPYRNWVNAEKRGLVPGKENAAFESVVRAKIEAAPKEEREPLRLLARITSTKVTKFLSTMAMGNHMYDMAVNRGITKARVLERVEAAARAASNAIVQPHLRLIERARSLPQETIKEINRLGQDSTSKGEWAFYPAHLREAVPDVNAPGGFRHEVSRKLGMQVKVNPELNARYKALPPEARKALTEMFKLTHDRLYDEKAAVLEHVTTSYDGMIADAKDLLAKTSDIKKRGDLIAEIKKYNAEKRSALNGYEGLLKIDPNTPYLPLNRNGNWVVTAKSDAYLKAEAAGDTDALAKMQKDPKHYFADFAGSQWEGHTLAGAISPTYGKVDQNVFVVERNKAADKLYAGRDMTQAVMRLENLAKQTDAPPGMRSLINDLKLKTLTQNSIRRSEMQRLNVAAGDLDMLRNVMSHGRAAAHFIGNLYHAEDVLSALQQVKKEVDYPGGKQTLTNRDDRQAVVNAITARHENNLSRPQDDDFTTLAAAKVNALTSVYMLALKPSYYVQQLLQSWMYSHPMMASRFGYAKASGALGQAYKTVAHTLHGTGPTDQIDVTKLPAKYRALADHLYQNGILDVGINTEMGGNNASQGLASTGEKVMDKVRGLSRKVEGINRLTAGIAQYDLDMANPAQRQTQHDAGAYDAYTRDFERLKDVQGHDFQPLTKEQFTAADNAVRLVRQSHGDLSMANSPAVFRGGIGRVLLQYKKFPLIMMGMMGKEIERSFFNKSIPPVERAIARKTFAYLLGHTAIMAGASGTIGYNVVKMLYDYVASQAEGEPHDMEADIRKELGNNALADLILKGAPTLADVDLSGTLGMGNTLSVAPFAAWPHDRRSLADFALSAMGPAIGGILPRVYDGLNYMHQGEYYKMAEDWTPKGISDTIRAIRERTQGVTNSKGELLVDPKNVPAMATVWRALGFSSLDQANRSSATDLKYETDDFYKQKVIDVKRDYINATTPEDKAQARADWKDLQTARVAHGLKRQPLGDLLTAPRDRAKRERNTAGGIQYTNRDKNEVEELTGLFASGENPTDETDPIMRDALQPQ